MIITRAQARDGEEIARLDCHIPPQRLEECIRNGRVDVLKAEKIVGVLRWSLFWQTIPFLDLLLIAEEHRFCGYGTAMLTQWEAAMQAQGYRYVMTSTQADEEAWRFYEKLGYRRAGGFFPPEQDAEEWMYLKLL